MVQRVTLQKTESHLQHAPKLWLLVCCCCFRDGELPGTPGAAAAAADASVGAGAPSGGIFDMQLPVAALQLLAGLLARSPKALLWMAGEPHRCADTVTPRVPRPASVVLAANAKRLDYCMGSFLCKA